MGVPVITLPGVRTWSRSAASVLSTLGMSDCIAESTQDYVRLAVQLAQDPRKIAQLRTSLRSRMMASPLMDKRAFARDMENAFRSMWHTWCTRSGG
jgi:predicted O-linked N-acetylglucosamine transferase (SPINDLY family)